MDSRFRGNDVTFEGAGPVILSGAKDLCSFRWFRYSRITTGILRGVYPERTTEILRFAQNDKRRTQDDTFRL
jgi:hypothetical protein